MVYRYRDVDSLSESIFFSIESRDFVKIDDMEPMKRFVNIGMKLRASFQHGSLAVIHLVC